jgi:hypothetical protein
MTERVRTFCERHVHQLRRLMCRNACRNACGKVKDSEKEENEFAPCTVHDRTVAHKIKAIKLSDWKKEIVCTICYDTHKKKDCWMTNCGHEFGLECLSETMIFTNQSTRRSRIHCPLCMKQITKITSYRQWGNHTNHDVDDDDIIDLVELNIQF